MPISDQIMRATMEELEASSGGSLVKHLHRLEITDTRSVLFVGLGGLGSKAVNTIKSIYLREYGYTDRVRFIAVDTCVEDQRDITAGHVDQTTGEPDGFMSGDELFQVFDEASIGLLTNTPRPPEIEGWIGNLEPRPLDASGAQGIRQIGRVMLCGTLKYRQLRNRIKDAIDSIHSAETPINVVILAGLGGGTGSGTFIDVSYMVRELLSDMASKNNQVYQWGVFFMPEVQHSIPAIRDNDVIWASLQRNGYAALKELDYFMNNGSELLDADPIYRLSAPGGLTVNSSKPIYADGRVFLVSGDGNRSCEETVASTARSVLNMFQRNSGTDAQAFTSDANNIPGYFNTWRNMNVGKNANGAQAELGIEGAEFPSFMNYRYLSPGYASVYFPRDEIMAYCANEVMAKVNDVWKGAARLNQNRVDKMLEAVGLDSPAHLLAASEMIMQLRAEDIRINKVADAAAWPEVTIFAFGYGHVRGTGATEERARKKAEDKVRAINNPQSLARLSEELSNALTVKLSDPDFITNNGPYAAIAALTGYGKLTGACDRLASMLAVLKGNNGYIEQLRIVAEAAKTNMEESARLLEADTTPTDAEVEVFIDACQAYSLAHFEWEFASSVMDKVIVQTRQRLMDFNNRTFEIYVPVLEALTSLLNRDSTILADTEHNYYDHGQSFGMDAFGLAESDAKRQLFVQLFGSYINANRTAMVARSFAQMMFGAEMRGKWEQLSGSPDELANAVRGAFEGFFAPFANDLLEKFCVLAYADSNALRGITPERLDQIWEAADGSSDALLRDTAIDAAGSAIARMLEMGSAPLIELEGGQPMLSKFYRRSFLTLLNGMDRLNAAITSNMVGGYGVGYISNDRKSVIRCTTYVGPIALPLVKDVSPWAREYFRSEDSADTRAGRHLDERNQNWARLLPEPFGMDAEDYYESNGRPSLVIKGFGKGADTELFVSIRDALTHGLEAGYIYFDNGPDQCFKAIHHVEIVPPNAYGSSSSFREACDAVIGRNREAALCEILHAAKDEFYSITYRETKLICNNGPLQGLQDATSPNPRKFSNLCRIVRSSIDLITCVLGAQNEYLGSATIADNGVLNDVSEAQKAYDIAQGDLAARKKYEKRLPLFTDMLLCGLVEWRQGRREGMGKWYYRRKPDAPFEEELCSISALRPGLELKMTLFLAFAKGVWNLSDRECELLQEVCNQLIDDGDYATPEEASVIQADARSVLEDIDYEPYEEKRNANVLSMVEASRAPEQYSVPKTIVTAQDAYDNIAGFYRGLLEGLMVS